MSKHNPPITLEPQQTQVEEERVRRAPITLPTNLDNDLQRSSTLAASTTPEQATETRRLSEQTGLPRSVIQTAPEEARQAARVRELFRAAQDASPMVQELIASDPGFAELVSDDVPNLSAIERSIMATRAAVGGINRAAEGFFGATFEAGANVLAQGGAFLAEQRILPANPFAELAQETSNVRRSSGQLSETIIGHRPEGLSVTEQSIYAGLESAGMNVTAIALGVLTGNPEVALGTMSAAAGGLKFGEALDAGYTPGRALLAGVGEAGFELITERLPVNRLFADLAKDTPFYKMVLAQLATEIPTEQAATILQDFNDWMVLNQDKTAAEFLDERPGAAYQTLIATVVGAGVITSGAHVVNQLGQRLQPAAQTQPAFENERAMLNLLNAVKQSKSAARDASILSRIAEDSVPEDADDVFIDARTLVNTLQQSGIDIDEVQEQIPSIKAQLREAMDVGGEIRIPLAEFASKVASQEFAETLLPHFRLGDEGMTGSEAREFAEKQAEEFRTEAEALLADSADAQLIREEADDIEERILAQLKETQRFPDDIAQTYASLIRGFFESTSARAKVRPSQLFAQFPLNVVAEDIEGEHLDQLPPEQFEVVGQQTGNLEINAYTEDRKRLAHLGAFPRGDDVLQIAGASVNESIQQQGVGQQLIMRAYEEAQGMGRRLISDTVVSVAQLRAYEALKRKGWTIRYSEPAVVANALATKEPTFSVTTQNFAPVVAEIAPPAPARARARLAAEAGEPAPGFTRFRHFGNKLVSQLDPEFMGTGMKGAEARRGGPKVISLYPQDERSGIPESGVGGVEFAVDVPTSRLYNANADPRGFLEEARNDSGNVDFSLFEELVRDAGFIGYTTPEAPGILQGQARLFEPVDVEARLPETVLYQLPTELEPQGFHTIKPHLTQEERDILRRDTAAKLVNLFKELPSDVEFAEAALAGEAKRGWYEQSTRVIRQIFGEADAPRFAALLAALSPQIDVQSNLKHAVQTWINWEKAGRPTDKRAIVNILRESVFDGSGEVLRAWVNNSVRALQAEDPTTVVLSGPKVNSFMKNLSGNMNEVTNDTWMANFAFVDQVFFKGEMPKSGKHPGKRPGYLAMNAKIRRVAKRLTRETGREWTPAHVQETIWSWAKTAYELAEAAGENRSIEELVREGAITDARVAGSVDFATLFTQDAPIVEIMRSAGYGKEIDAIGVEFGREQPSEDNGEPRAVTPALLRSARRLDRLRNYRDANGAQALERALQHEPGTALIGLPGSSLGPIAAIQEAAQRYVDSLPNAQDLPPHTVHVRVNPERAARIAKAYEEMKHDPTDFEVEASYEAMIAETLAQYQVVKELGIQIEFIKPGQDDPYPEGPRQVHEDLRRNHLWVFPTEGGFGQEDIETQDNPLLAETDEVVGDRKLLVNDVFRIVHDIFGHGKEGVGFGPSGEDNAWHSHMRMYSRTAAHAMTSETRGQNSWVNYGPHGEANRANQKETVYAEQKTGLLPEWVMNDGIEEGSASTALAQDARGQISLPPNMRDGATIALLKDADLSTFLHEAGHFFFEVYSQIAIQQSAPQEVIDDMRALLDWVGFDGTVHDWARLSIEKRREYHETFARGFERYLFEGRAPNQQMRDLFHRFRAWLINIYKTVRGLKVELTDEVRSVMDRMLATQEQIEAAQNMRRYANLFTSQQQAGMTEDEWLDYQALAARSTEQAQDELQKRSLRDLKWLRNARAKVIQELQKTARDRRREVKEEVTEDVNRERVYVVQNFLRTGEAWVTNPETGQSDLFDVSDLGGTHKLSIPVLEEMYSYYADIGLDAPWKKLTRSMLGREGLHPDLVADMFGYSSGDELVKDLLAAPDKSEVIESRTDQLMLQRYGDLVDAQAIERAADLAVHNEARMRLVASELRALDRANRVRERTSKGSTVNALLRAAKDFAQRIIDSKKIRDIRPGQFTQAETRAQRATERALTKGDTQGAAREKRNQMLNGYAARFAHEARNEIERKLKYLKKFNRDTLRKHIDPDYMDQIDKLLERFELREVSLRQLDKRKALLEWVEEQREMGLEPTIDDALLAEAQRLNYKDITLEQFRGLVDAVRNIEHLGRLKKKLLTERENRDFEAAVDAMARTIRDNASKTIPEELEHKAFSSRIKRGVKEFFALHRKLGSLSQQFDGWVDGGVFWDYFMKPLNEAGDREATMIADATKKMHEILQPILKTGNMNRKTYISEIGTSLTREARIAVALNWGNDANRQRVRDGDSWTDDQVQAILDTLTKEEWDFVQATWDYIDSFWPQIAAKEKRVTGVEPQKVQATPVDTKFGTLRGGYYPISYDPLRSSKAEADVNAEAIQNGMRGLYVRASTRRGHVEARVKEVKERPVRKDLGVVTDHLTQIIHDLTHHEALIDTNRLIRAKAVDQAIRRHYGPEVLRQFREGLEAIAAGDVPAKNSFERGINHLRTGATIAGLGYNLMTSLLQPIGLTQSWVRIGPKWVGVGLSRWIGGAVKMDGVVNSIYEKSPFMKLRGQTLQREISEIRNKITGQTNKWTDVQATFFYMIQKMQLVADVPTWLGQYEKTMQETGDEALAIKLADQAVLDSQGGGQIKDLAGIQRGGPLMKLWTNFYSFFNTTFNLTARATRRTDFRKPGQVGRLAVDYLMLFTIPTVLATLLRSAIQGDDWDDEELAEQLVRDQLSFMLSTMVGVREVGSAVAGFSYRGPAGGRAFVEFSKLVEQAQQGEIDAAFLRALNNVSGILFHYPAGQVQRTVEGVAALAEGDSENPGVILTGPPRE